MHLFRHIYVINHISFVRACVLFYSGSTLVQKSCYYKDNYVNQMWWLHGAKSKGSGGVQVDAKAEWSERKPGNRSRYKQH